MLCMGSVLRHLPDEDVFGLDRDGGRRQEPKIPACTWSGFQPVFAGRVGLCRGAADGSTPSLGQWVGPECAFIAVREVGNCGCDPAANTGRLGVAAAVLGNGLAAVNTTTKG